MDSSLLLDLVDADSFDSVSLRDEKLLLLLLDATDLPLLETGAADEATGAGAGVFFEKKENKFFCLGVAMVAVAVAGAVTVGAPLALSHLDDRRFWCG